MVAEHSVRLCRSRPRGVSPVVSLTCVIWHGAWGGQMDEMGPGGGRVTAQAAGHARPHAAVGDDDGTEMDVPSRCFETLENKDRTGQRGRSPKAPCRNRCCGTVRPLIANHEVATRGRVADEAARVEWTRWELWPNRVPSGLGPNLGAGTVSRRDRCTVDSISIA